VDDRRNEPQEPRTLRKSFVPANAKSRTVGHKVILRAIKNINPGDEITYSYGRDYFINVITPRGCKCAKCRKKRSEARAKARGKKRRRRISD